MERKFRLSRLLHFLKSEGFSIKFPDNYQDFVIQGFSAFTKSEPETLTWMKENTTQWSDVKASVVICPIDVNPPPNLKCFLIRVDNPRLAFTKILNKFHSDPFHPKIDETAILSETCEMGENVYIGPYVVIGENVKIGDGTTIHSHAKLYADTTIKENCIIHSGCVLGGDGFGYEREGNKTPVKIKHIGGVIIHENVEIGSNSCIDRGTLANTIIGEHTKISNLCNIAHNVAIGRNVMICAKACVNGSTRIGDNVWVSPDAVINNGLVLGEGCTVGLGAVVIRDVEPIDVVAGVPARSLK